ncbi:t-SNARE [Scleroderma yunnanense]
MSSPSSSSLPTTRSRTLLFISYRDSRTPSTRFSRPYDEPDQSADENEHLITRHLTLDLHLPPKWVDLAEQVGEILASVHSKRTCHLPFVSSITSQVMQVGALEKLHTKRALPGFTDRSAEEREIEAATANITNDLRQCHTLIQRISSDHAHSFPPSNRNHHELLTAQNVQRGLAARVQELSSAFRKKQRIYMERLQGHAIKNQDLLIASGTISSKGSEGLSAVDDDVQAAQAQIMETDQTHQDLHLRDRELTHIANSIASLADLFKDLSILVIDQGTLLDSIEYNIEQTSVQVTEAVKELDIATRYQKNTGRRKIIFLLLLIIFGLIIILIFKPRRHSSPSPSDAALDSLPSSSFVPVYMRPRTP